MEKSNVAVTIQSLQRLETGTETMSQHIEGRLTQKGRGWLLTYWEGKDSGLGRTRTTLRIEEDRAILERTGELTSQMIFQVGCPHMSLYETPYGKLPMTVQTLSLKTNLTETGGTVSIHYQIQLGEGSAGETRLRLTLRTKEKEYDR